MRLRVDAGVARSEPSLRVSWISSTNVNTLRSRTEQGRRQDCQFEECNGGRTAVTVASRLVARAAGD